jgi:hypothetical protein
VEGSGTWIQDWYLEADGFFGQKKYGFVYEPSAGSMDMVKPAAWVYQDGTDGQKAFLQAENVYRAFVRDQYLELSAEEGDLIHQAFFNGDGWEDTDQIYTITSRIRTVLRILASYTDTPKTVPAGQDFLKWFMQEGHEGNSAYFATAAVLAYRGAGIPARYVEGYLLTEEKAKAMEEQDGNTAVTLTGQDSHAWVEIYVDGMGWKSVEVTPGFYNGPHKADILVAVPNEALEGSNGQMAGIPSSEDYEMPDIEEDLHAEEAGGNRPLTVVTALLLILVGLLLFLENCRLLQTLIMMSKYKKMSYRQQFFHQYDGILACMVIMIPEFHDTQPLDIINKAEAIADFDVDLYVRTVERLERCIYGELEPGKQEVTTAEALNHNLKTLCKRKQPWYIRVIGRYKKIGCFQFLTHFIK